MLITGAAGFIGRSLADRLRRDGAEVVGVDLVADEALGVVAGDIRWPGEWQRAAAGCDVMIHTAALVGMPSDTSRFWDVNVNGTHMALEAARDNGVGRFVHISSAVTFGLHFPDGVDESYPVRHTGMAYVDTKIAAEHAALMAHASGQQEVAVVRPSDTYGPGSRPWTLLPLELLRRGRAVLPARGHGIHSPIYVDDVVDGIVRAATTPAAAGRVVTLSGGVGVETRDYFGRFERDGGRHSGHPRADHRAETAEVVAGLDPHATAQRYHLAGRLGRCGRPNDPVDDIVHVDRTVDPVATGGQDGETPAQQLER